MKPLIFLTYCMRGRPDLLVGRGRLEVVQGLDVPAHDDHLVWEPSRRIVPPTFLTVPGRATAESRRRGTFPPAAGEPCGAAGRSGPDDGVERGRVEVRLDVVGEAVDVVALRDGGRSEETGRAPRASRSGTRRAAPHGRRDRARRCHRRPRRRRRRGARSHRRRAAAAAARRRTRARCAPCGSRSRGPASRAGREGRRSRRARRRRAVRRPGRSAHPPRGRSACRRRRSSPRPAGPGRRRRGRRTRRARDRGCGGRASGSRRRCRRPASRRRRPP